MKRFVLGLVFLLFLFLPHQSWAADEGWVVDRFASDIRIERTGDVRVTETIRVDFGSLFKHGIYRDIPYVYERDGEKTYTEIAVESVLQNGKRGTFAVSRNDGYIRLKIGDADTTISGKNIYTIIYTARGVLRGFGDHDELYWNVTGDNWPVPINRVEASVSLPADGMMQAACLQGYAGSQGDCSAEIASPQLARFVARDSLAVSQGMTIVAGYKKGLVPLITAQRPVSFWEKFISWPSLGTLFVAFVFGIGTIFYLWYRHGRDFWSGTALFAKKSDNGSAKPIGSHETVVVEYTPPEKLRPAELGVLMDEKADTHDIVATIIDLASRGYLTITEVEKKWMFGKTDYILNRKNILKKDKLLGYEKLLLDKLFPGDTTMTVVSTLKTTFYEELKEIKQALYDEVVAKKLFPMDPEKVRGKYLLIAVLLVFAGVGIGGFAIAREIVLLADIGVGIGVSGILLIIVSQFMPRRTAYGRDLYRRAKGYYLFINTAEKYRQQFFEKKNLFNEVLPFAIVFGLTGKFAKQMQDIGLQTTHPGWYVGTHPFTVANFGSSIDDFSQSMSSAIASTPSGSGFSGGSSGGGFGGGGGGSW